MRHYHTKFESVGFVIRKIAGVGGAACALFKTGTTGLTAMARPNLLQTAMFVLAILALPLLVMGIAAGLAYGYGDHVQLSSLGYAGAALMGTVAEPKKPANIRKMEADLKALATELEQGQIEMAAGPISQERGEELEQKAQEMQSLQDHIDRYNKIAGITGKAKQVQSVTMPDMDERNRKMIRTTAGHLFVASDEFKRFQERGKGVGSGEWSGRVATKSRSRLVTLRGEEAVAFEKKAFDAATLSTLGTDAIIPIDRDPELVRFEEPEILTLRDVLNVVQTGSDTIKYVRQTGVTRNAESQASRGALKKFLKVAFDTANASVETIAVLSKVTEQDIADAPRLVGLINGEMTLDINVEEERQIARGSGEDGELLGLFDAESGLEEFARAGEDDTIIDIIRKMRTDLRKARVTPNFVAIDPLDWEQVELAKGSDDRYIWGLITDLRGPRIWSLRVIESDAMTDPDTNERRILMGDGIRGATLYDRSGVELAVGLMDDDFGRNLRTLRAEKRVAMAIKRSFAFKYAISSPAES